VRSRRSLLTFTATSKKLQPEFEEGFVGLVGWPRNLSGAHGLLQGLSYHCSLVLQRRTTNVHGTVVDANQRLVKLCALKRLAFCPLVCLFPHTHTKNFALVFCQASCVLQVQ